MNRHIQQLLQAFAHLPKGRERNGQIGFMVPSHSPFHLLSWTVHVSCCKSCDAGSIQIRWLKAVSHPSRKITATEAWIYLKEVLV